MKTSAIVLGALLMGAGVMLFGCREETAPKVAPPPEVLVTPVIQRDVPVSAEWVGTTDGYNNAQIRSRVKGYLLTRAYREGSPVKAGELLFTIDARPYRTALAQARAGVARAQAAELKTRLDVRRYTPLVAKGAVSRQELENAIQANKASEAAVAAEMATVEQAQLEVDWTEVRSPIDGVAGIANAQIGDLIGETTLLATVSQLDPMKVTFSLPERDYLRFAERVRRFRTMQPSEGEGPLEMVLADGQVYGHKGRFSLADRQVDAATGAITVQCVFPNPEEVLRPGLYAKVRAVTETKAAALLVPQRAVQELQGTYQVAVVGADDAVSLRTVTVGDRVGSLWIVETGLQQGDRVVVEGLQKVRNGATVTPKPAPAAAGGE